MTGRPAIIHLPPLTKAVVVATLAGCRFTTAEVAEYAGCAEQKAQGYLAGLASEDVVTAVGDGWTTGPGAKAWRTSRPMDRHGGNSQAGKREREQAAVWDMRAHKEPHKEPHKEVSRTSQQSAEKRRARQSEVLTTGEVCVRLNICRRTVAYRLAAGIPGAFLFGGRWRIPVAWVQAQMSGGGITAHGVPH